MEPDFPLTSLSWRQLAFWILAAFVGGGGTATLVSLWANRGKRKAETENTDAQTGQLEITTSITAGDAIARFIRRLEMAQASNDRLRNERDEWHNHAAAFEMRAERAEAVCDKQAVALDLQDKQIRKLKAILTINAIRYQDYDHLTYPDSDTFQVEGDT
jgi:hypothetical protein